jgi:hypothetical protein
MTRARRVAGHPFPGREQLAAALATAELSEQALVNYAALSRFSGSAWIDRYRERPKRDLPIPLQRQAERLYRAQMSRIAPQGVPHVRRR